LRWKEAPAADSEGEPCSDTLEMQEKTKCKNIIPFPTKVRLEARISFKFAARSDLNKMVVGRSMFLRRSSLFRCHTHQPQSAILESLLLFPDTKMNNKCFWNEFIFC
jgi:hypothetical protein